MKGPGRRRATEAGSADSPDSPDGLPSGAETPDAARAPRGSRRRPGAGSQALLVAAEIADTAARYAARVARNRYGMAALVLVAVLALYGVAALSRPGDSGGSLAGRAEAVPVTTALRSCARPERSRLTALRPAAAAEPGGRAALTDPAGKAVAALPASGVAWQRDVGRAPAAYTVRADGPAAAGLSVERTAYDARGADRALAGGQCGAPATDQWFVGSGPLEADDIEVHLANPEPRPATADLLALSGEGPLDTTDGRAIAVPPNGSKIVRLGESADGLGDLVDNARILALNVRTGTGRVTAAVRVRMGDGEGADWLPRALPPARSLIVPGLPAGSGRRRLMVAVPGDADTIVRVRVIGEEGDFAPGGVDVLEAPARTVTALDLDRALAGRPGALRLESGQPIVAGFFAERGADIAYGTATEPLGPDGGVVADNRFDSTVLLTAPAAAAKVRLTGVAATGPAGTPQQVTVPAGRTMEVRLPAAGAAGRGVRIVALPGSGPLHAARVMSVGKGAELLFTLLPVEPARVRVRTPELGESVTSLLP